MAAGFDAAAGCRRAHIVRRRRRPARTAGEAFWEAGGVAPPVASGQRGEDNRYHGVSARMNKLDWIRGLLWLSLKYEQTLKTELKQEDHTEKDEPLTDIINCDAKITP